jgi:uncharacterized protein YjiS (DUF1127 family)
MSTVVHFTARSNGSAPYSLVEFLVSVGRRLGMPMLSRAIANFSEWRRKQRAIAQLEALDDYHLRDMGVARCEIWYRVNHPLEY